MPPRRCLNCGHPFTGPRCPRSACSSRAARGYGAAHQAARRVLAKSLPAPCGYCGRLIGTEDQWHAAHVVDGDPSRGWMAAHANCNERAKRR